MKRSEIKDVHENSVLESFVSHSAGLGKITEIIDKPEPPDALVTINGNKTWVEITDAFLSCDLAKSITTYVADDQTHKPVPREKRKCIDPDKNFSDIFESVILKKFNKRSIGKVYRQYGGGILLVGIINPFSDARELVNTEKKKILDAIKLKEPRFDEIYLYGVHDHVFYQLL